MQDRPEEKTYLCFVVWDLWEEQRHHVYDPSCWHKKQVRGLISQILHKKKYIGGFTPSLHANNTLQENMFAPFVHIVPCSGMQRLNIKNM